MKTVYVIFVTRTIGARTESYPIGCRMLLKGAQHVMAKYVAEHKLDVANGDIWLAEQTTIRVYTMLTEISNNRTANRIDVRISQFKIESETL